MLTEVDTRDNGGETVVLYMDADAETYLVCVEGHTPLEYTDRAAALAAWKHPYAYLPLEGSVSRPNGTEGGSPTPGSYVPDRLVEDVTGARLTDMTSEVLCGLKDLLRVMNDSDFRWMLGVVNALLQDIGSERGVCPPYNYGDPDGPDIEFWGT